MDLKSVVQFPVILLYIIQFRIDAIELRFSQPVATAGHDFSITCVVEGNTGHIAFTKNTSRICTIVGARINGSCTIDGLDYEKSFTYTCDLVNKMYTVNIPGQYVYQNHNSKWYCERSIPYQNHISQLKMLYVNVPVTVVTLLSSPDDLTTVIAEENKPKRLVCKTSPVRPSARIQWYLSGTNITSSAVPQQDSCYTDCNDDKVISSSVLVYTWSRNDSGISILCAAVNIDGYIPVNSSVKRIDVQYTPSEMTFSIPKRNFTVRENDILGPISCNASCNPSCTYTWSGPGINTMTRELQITKIQRSHTGNFTCTATNTIGTLQHHINILVLYPAKVKNITVSTGLYTVVEESDVKLTCTTEGEPVPTISWNFLDAWGQHLLLKANDILSSELLINKTKCGDTGRYSCKVDNRLYPPSIRSVDLNITCPPRQNISCSSKTSLEVQRKDVIKINVCWIANPAPEIIWTSVYDYNVNSALSSSMIKLNPILYSSVLEKIFPDAITVIYKVIARNNHGISQPVYYTITVRNKTESESLIRETKDSDKIIYIGIGFCCGLATCGIIRFIIFGFRKIKRKTPRNSVNYVEFQSPGGMELQSYDCLDQHKSDMH